MDILNFSSSSSDYVLNFGVEETNKYESLKLQLDLDFNLFPILYLEFTRVYNSEEKLLRYFKYEVVDFLTLEVLEKGSSKFFRAEEDELFSLVLNLQKYIDKNIKVTLELKLDESETNLDFKGIKNLKLYLGK